VPEFQSPTERLAGRLSGKPSHGCRAPPLNQADVSKAAPGALFWVLRNGSLYRGMPPFAHLPKPQRWQIITFLCETEADERGRSENNL
jgi:hypothetical protein